MSNELQEAMSKIKKIDSVPKDQTLVLYTHEAITKAEYEGIMNSMKQLKEDGDIRTVVVMPHDKMELQAMSSEDVERLQNILGIGEFLKDIRQDVYNLLDLRAETVEFYVHHLMDKIERRMNMSEDPGAGDDE